MALWHGKSRANAREPAVAGMFYPCEAGELAAMVGGYLAEAASAGDVPRALIAPHAGYIYSGPIAASAYILLKPAARRFERVVLLGPSHRVPFAGLALSSAEAFLSPLGPLPVDQDAVHRIRKLRQVRVRDAAHALEHSLEVHLPFLQTVLEDFRLVPLVVGDAAPSEVGEVLDELWDGDETLVVVSSDLSHYHDYASAQALDEATGAAIERLDPSFIGPQQACGCRPVNGLLHVARQRGLEARILDQRNSGDTAGDRDQVVGYGAYAFFGVPV